MGYLQKTTVTRFLILVLIVILGAMFLFRKVGIEPVLAGAPGGNRKTVIRVNANKIIKPVNKYIFGTSIPKIARHQWLPPLDLKDINLKNILNDLKPSFITIDNNQLGLPFYPESTGEISKRLGTLSTLERINITASKLGKELLTHVKKDPFYNKDQPPHKNYDDLLQFFERLDFKPSFSLRIPIIFTDQNKKHVTLKHNLDPKTGADLVHYLNDNPTTKLGKLRAQNGRTEPYNVEFFVLGNELWSNHDRGNLSLKQIASQVIAFAVLMKQADPSIKIGISLVDDAYPHEYFKHGITDRYKKRIDYNKNLLSSVGKHIDFVTFHVYGGLGGADLSAPLNKKQWRYIMAQNFLREKYHNTPKHKKIARLDNDKLEIAVDEFSGPLNSLGGALYNAEYIIYLLNNDYIFATNWSLGLIEPNNDFSLIKVMSDKGKTRYIRKPNYYVLKMFTNYFGDSIVETDVESSTFETEAIKWKRFFDWPREKNIPDIKTIASVKGSKLYVMIINRRLDKNIKVSISLTGFRPSANAKVYLLTGPSIDATNEKKPANVRIKKSEINFASDSFDYEINKHSITIMEFAKIVD